MAGGKRDLSAEESELWRRVTSSARPLFADAKDRADVPAEPDRSASAPRPREKAGNQPRSAHIDARPAPPSPKTIDRRTEQRLRRGAIPIDGRLDLHGLTQRRAHAALHHFIAAAHKRGWRTVLVITGKGSPRTEADPPMYSQQERGVLARQVPQWLASAEFTPFVSGFREAHRRHGGHGALYVRIRRAR